LNTVDATAAPVAPAAYAVPATRRRLSRLACVADFRHLAKKKLPRAVFDFVDGGAGHEYTLRWNEEAFQRYAFRPQVLTDMTALDIGSTVLGAPVALPALLGPSGAQRLVWRDGELAAARAAAAYKTVYVLGVASSFTMEEVAEAAPGARLWFQLYLWHGRGWAHELLARMRNANYEALCLTVDIKAPGGRKYRDIRNGIARMPESLNLTTVFDAARRPRWLTHYFFGRRVRMVHMLEGGKSASMFNATAFTYRRMDPSATWEEVRWLRKLWDGPLVLKGIMNPEDARMAFDCGADAVVCSNHGGRNLDGAPATLDVLPRIAEVGDACGKEVYLDGGVRTGGDVVKAMALGAHACFVVRPFIWGLAAGGQKGAEAVLDIYRREILSTMTYLGLPTLSRLDRKAIEERS
jgi:L-lactate dehydrogenase (cytochrome)